MNIHIRKYSRSDAKELLALYYDTVHQTNSKDYQAEQIEAWVPSATEGIEVWRERFADEKTLVAEVDGRLAGFGNLHGKSIGMLYVGQSFLGQGVGTALLEKLEKKLKKKEIDKALAEVSITARPFFERHGYRWVKDHRKMFNGQEFLNFIMEKDLDHKEIKMKKKELGKKVKSDWSGVLIQKFIDLLIVIAGVTIAFQLNNLKTESDQNTLERFYYESLIADLNEDIKDIEFIIGTLRDDRKLAGSFLRKLDHPEVPPDSLGTVAVNLMALESFSGNQNTYLTLLNGNGLTNVKNRTIRRQITEYYSLYTYLQRFEKIHTDLITEFYNYISPYCDLQKQEITNPEVVLKVQTKNYMIIFGELLGGGIEDCEETLKQAKELKSALENQLKPS